MKNYVVVKFHQAEKIPHECAVVPKTWLRDYTGRSFYVPYISELLTEEKAEEFNSLVKGLQAPDPKWKMYKCQVQNSYKRFRFAVNCVELQTKKKCGRPKKYGDIKIPCSESLLPINYKSNKLNNLVDGVDTYKNVPVLMKTPDDEKQHTRIITKGIHSIAEKVNAERKTLKTECQHDAHENIYREIELNITGNTNDNESTFSFMKFSRSITDDKIINDTERFPKDKPVLLLPLRKRQFTTEYEKIESPPQLNKLENIKATAVNDDSISPVYIDFYMPHEVKSNALERKTECHTENHFYDLKKIDFSLYSSEQKTSDTCLPKENMTSSIVNLDLPSTSKNEADVAHGNTQIYYAVDAEISESQVQINVPHISGTVVSEYSPSPSLDISNNYVVISEPELTLPVKNLELIPTAVSEVIKPLPDRISIVDNNNSGNINYTALPFPSPSREYQSPATSPSPQASEYSDDNSMAFLREQVKIMTNKLDETTRLIKSIRDEFSLNIGTRLEKIESIVLKTNPPLKKNFADTRFIFPLNKIEELTEYGELLHCSLKAREHLENSVTYALNPKVSLTRNIAFVLKKFITSHLASQYTTIRSKNDKKVFINTRFYDYFKANFVNAMQSGMLPETTEHKFIKAVANVISNWRDWDCNRWKKITPKKGDTLKKRYDKIPNFEVPANESYPVHSESANPISEEE